MRWYLYSRIIKNHQNQNHPVMRINLWADENSVSISENYHLFCLSSLIYQYFTKIIKMLRLNKPTYLRTLSHCCLSFSVTLVLCFLYLRYLNVNRFPISLKYIICLTNTSYTLILLLSVYRVFKNVWFAKQIS